MFVNPQNLNNHVETIHEGMKKFKCDFCDRTFTWNSHRKDHMIRKHLGEMPLDKTPVQNINSYQCEICEKIFTKKQHFDRHLAHIHGIHKDKTYMKHKCDNCDKEFFDKRDLSRHIANSHGVKI